MQTDINVADVRAWARQAGFAVGDRGRLSPKLVSAYRSAHGSDTAPEPSPARAGRGSRPAAIGRSRTVHAKSSWDWVRKSA